MAPRARWRRVEPDRLEAGGATMTATTTAPGEQEATSAEGAAQRGLDPGPVDLRGFLAPRRVALVGASERSGWTALVLAGLDASPGLREVALVNPHRPVVHGRLTVPDLADLPAPPDLVFV